MNPYFEDQSVAPMGYGPYAFYGYPYPQSMPMSGNIPFNGMQTTMINGNSTYSPQPIFPASLASDAATAALYQPIFYPTMPVPTTATCTTSATSNSEFASMGESSSPPASTINNASPSLNKNLENLNTMSVANTTPTTTTCYPYAAAAYNPFPIKIMTQPGSNFVNAYASAGGTTGPLSNSPEVLLNQLQLFQQSNGTGTAAPTGATSSQLVNLGGAANNGKVEGLF